MTIRELQLQGFKSFGNEKAQSIEFGDITVLLGANGAGKSNLVDFFRMLSAMFQRELQLFVGKNGVENLLYYGPKQTEKIQFSLELGNEEKGGRYNVELSFSLDGKPFISEEHFPFKGLNVGATGAGTLDGGYGEREITVSVESLKDEINVYVRSIGQNIQVFQFHDTSETAKIKSRVYIDDCKVFRGDNLAPFLLRLRETGEYKRYYSRIIRQIQKVMPQFQDFSLEVFAPRDEVRLNWLDKTIGRDYIFSPHQISDGSLRFMGLATLLLQPPDLLPKFIVLDEPELGLHPAAIVQLAGMIRTCSKHAQIVLATQSTRLVDEFGLENVVIVERDEQKRSTVFKKFNKEDLVDWLKRYSLSELWEKNVLGGLP